MMANNMFSSNVTGTNNALSNFISQSLGGRGMSDSVSGLAGLLGDYSAVKNGSYGKLMKAYYAKDKASVSSTDKVNKEDKTDKKDTVNKTQQMTAPIAKTEADKTSAEAASKLVDSASALDKLSYKEENLDKIADAVSAFVKEYNNTLQVANDSKLINVRQNGEWLAGGTKSNEKLLASVGVTINEDNTLSVDTDALKKGNISTIKNLFDGSSSFAHQVANRATKIYAEAASGGTAANAYTEKGDYSTLTTGAMLDSLM